MVSSKVASIESLDSIKGFVPALLMNLLENSEI